MNAQLLIKAAITVALVLLANVLTRRPGDGALLASLPVTSLRVLGWRYANTPDPNRSRRSRWASFVLRSLPFFVVLPGPGGAASLVLAALAGFGGMLLAQWLPTRDMTGVS